jgi:Carboxypeptidase regulatory-like domain
VHPTGRRTTWVCAAALLAAASPLRAQASRATLSGTVTDSAGAAIRNVSISIKNITTSQSTDTKTDSAGRYSVASLQPGDYTVSASAAGFDSVTARVTIAAGASQTLNLTLRAGLSLADLGFTTSETRGSAEAQARLDRRSHMLQIHQRLGLITAGALLATVVTGGFAGGRSTSTPDRTVHLVLGSLTTGLYFTSASFAIFAPKIAGTKTRGPIRLHKALAWIHGPGMILTPVLGAMAFDQRSRGERVHGIARLHGIVGISTAAAYGLSILSVSLKF